MRQLLEQIGEGRAVVSFVGGGGKTTAIFLLGELLHAQGVRVAATTTTHFQVPDWIIPSFPVFGVEENGKLSPVKVFPTGFDVVLVEADGAHHMPLKAPRSHEPVIPPETTHLVIVAGLWAIGQTVAEGAFFPDGVCALLDVDMAHDITRADILTVATHPMGGRKNAENLPYTVLLNGTGPSGEAHVVTMDLEVEKQRFLAGQMA